MKYQSSTGVNVIVYSYFLKTVSLVLKPETTVKATGLIDTKLSG